jgi:hypothetical protein
MFRIQLVVTGVTEEEGLRVSLMRYFPDRRNGRKVEWLPPRKIDGATTHRLRHGEKPSEPMRKLAKTLLTEARYGKTGISPDLVIAVDDVELDNYGQEDVIAEHLRAALKNVLDEQKGEAARLEACRLLREKCSFHLLCPMVESYFFGDPHALLAAGVPASEKPKLIHEDVEKFETSDPRFLPECAFENNRRASHSPWWRHERHSKLYLDHLARRSRVHFHYEETVHGKAALQVIAWNRVPSTVAATPIIRSLFEDLAVWFDVPNPLGQGDTHPRLFPDPKAKHHDLILRNL